MNFTHAKAWITPIGAFVALLVALLAAPAAGDDRPNGVAARGTRWLDLVHAREAWTITRGDPKTVIAIVDTGVDATHPDLEGRIAGGTDLYNGDDDPADDNGHGTAVAGIAAAVCPECSLLAVKVQDERGGSASTLHMIARGIVWATDHGARIVNVSAETSPSPQLANALRYAARRGVVVVAAAGNRDDLRLGCPACYPGVVAVGGTDFRGRRLPYSNFSPALDVAAPAASPSAGRRRRARYVPFSGTSAATPVVAGALGLLLSARPKLTAAGAIAVLQRATRDAGPAGADDDYGSGLLDVRAMLAAAHRPPRLRPACRFPAIPPQIAFVSSCSGNFELYAGTRRLTYAPADDLDPSFSPDGRRIAFVREDGEFDRLLTIAATGGRGRRLTSLDGDLEAPAWSPDGSSIAFERNGDIYVVPAVGGAARAVTEDSNLNGTPGWSPDGATIVFASAGTSPGLYLVPAGGGRPHRLTTTPPNRVDRQPDWSPDGTHIAFVRSEGRRPWLSAIYVVRADGKGVRAITKPADEATSPAWSPEGRAILFSSRRNGDPDINSVRPNGTGLRPVVTTAGSEVAVTTRRSTSR